MKLGAMNHPKKDIYDEIEWIGKNNFDFVDLAIEPPLIHRNIDSERISMLCKKYNLGLIGHTNPTLPAIYPIKEVRDTCLNYLKESIMLFSRLKINQVNIHPYYYGTHLEANEKLELNITLISELSRFCSKHKIDLMLENYINPFNTVETFKHLVHKIPELKIHLDIGHCNFSDRGAVNEVDDFFKEFGKRIVHLHIHDNNGMYDEHLPLGCGKINWAEIVRILKRYRYNRTATLEIFAKDKDYLILSRNKFAEKWNK